jgi:septum formation topological specificity factor MinE
MKITKDYLKQVIKEEYSRMQEMQDTLSPVKKELLAILSQRVGSGMDAELLVHVLTDEEAETLLRQQKASHKV